MSLEFASSLYPAFYIGVVVKRYELHDMLFSNSKIYLLGLIAVLTYILTDAYGIRYHGGMILFQYGFIIILLYILFKTEAINNIINRYLSFIGKNTLDVYIYHYFVLQMCKMLWIGKFLNGIYSPLVEFIVTGSITIIVGTVSVYIGKILKDGFQFENLRIR